jgi:hypothetical protein
MMEKGEITASIGLERLPEATRRVTGNIPLALQKVTFDMEDNVATVTANYFIEAQ